MMVALIVIYMGVCFLVEQHTTRVPDLNNAAKLRPYMIATGLIALVGSVTWLRMRVDGKIGEQGSGLMMPTSQFLIESIIALSLPNFCAMQGIAFFFMGASFKELAIFALGALFVDFAFILPRGLQFWAAVERRGSI
jgi:hypothetical protein